MDRRVDRPRTGGVSLPRDRWVGASPGLNVTPGGKALEALDQIVALARENDLVLREQIEEIVAAVNLDF